MSKDIHLMRVDILCSKCNYKNKGEYNLDEPMDIICCGKCGEILSKPEGMTIDEQAKIKSCVQQTLEEEA